MHRYIHAFIYCFLAANLFNAHARDSRARLTLAEAISEARAKNPEMRALEAALTASKGGILTARTYANPELTFAPGVRRSLQDTSFVTDFKGVLSLNQLFKFPGKRTLEIAIAEHDAKLRQLAIEAFRFQIAAKVSRAFYDMLATQKIVEVRNEQLGSAKIFVESAQKRAESGFAGDFETIKGQADLVTARVALREAEGRVATARITLNTLLGRQPPTPLAITGSLENLAPRGGVTDFNALAMGRNPALQAQVIRSTKIRLESAPDPFWQQARFCHWPHYRIFQGRANFRHQRDCRATAMGSKKG